MSVFSVETLLYAVVQNTAGERGPTGPATDADREDLDDAIQTLTDRPCEAGTE